MTPLPDWLDPLYEAQEMRAVDEWAVGRGGVPSLDLMESAGLGLARVVARHARPGPIRVLIGKGNNGGDGLVAARYLREEGREVDVLSPAPVADLRGDAAANLARLAGPPPAEPVPAEIEAALAGSGAIVDAILGTGFAGSPRDPAAAAIEAINASAGPGGRERAPVIACDVPSGVDASSGEIAGAAVRADVTVTFHGEKIGLRVMPGAAHAGAIETVAIGVPRGAPAARAAGLISERVLALYPHRRRHGSKFSSGVVVVAGGSRGLTGAPAMAAMAAQRAGAGYVQVAVPESAQPALDLRLLEAMTRGLPEEEGEHVPGGVDALARLAERAGAVVLGPGLGRGEGAQEFARAAARRLEAAMVIDADGLNAHAGALADLRSRPGPTVLTPHEAELGRLLGCEPDAVAAHRLARAREAAEASRCVVLLKGDDTIVAAPGGPVAVNPGATPALATAGTGDVLSGLIGALLAKGLGPFEAAALGARAHARAGLAAAARHGADHTIASDVIEALPRGLDPAAL